MNKDLKEFIDFRKNYDFKPLEIVEKGFALYCEDQILRTSLGDYYSCSPNWINVGYGLSNDYSKLLSNLFHYDFTFYGCDFGSLEGFFQGIKFKDPEVQKLVFKYSGREAVALKNVTDYDWTTTGEVYFLGKKIKRDSEEYDNLINELYFSAIQNPLYRGALRTCNLPIIHPIGKLFKEETTFTRYEFEHMLNSLSEYVKLKDKTVEEEVNFDISKFEHLLDSMEKNNDSDEKVIIKK